MANRIQPGKLVTQRQSTVKIVSNRTGRPRLRTLTARNTIERFRTEKKVRRKTTLSFTVAGILLVIIGIIYLYNTGFFKPIITSVLESVSQTKERIISIAPLKAKPKIVVSKNDSIKRLVSRINTSLPFFRKRQYESARPIAMLNYKSILFPIGKNLIVQKKIEGQYYDLPVLEILPEKRLSVEDTLNEVSYIIEMLSIMEKQIPSLSCSITSISLNIREKAALISFSDSPVRIKTGYLYPINEQIDNIAVVKRNIVSGTDIEINMEHSGIAFVKMGG